MSYSRRKSDRVWGMEVMGDGVFRLRTREALGLLQALAEFELIGAHLGVLRQGKRSGIEAWAEPPVFTVGAATWKYSPLWFASAIAHDAYHAKLYRDAKKRNPETEPAAETWTGKAAERVCLAFQRQVLLSLDADPAIIDYIENHAQNPVYQGCSTGWRGWLDYRKRWW